MDGQPEPSGEAAAAARASPPLVVVGASGSEGLRQLAQLLRLLPPDLGAAVLVVLHRPVDRRSALPEILARTSALPVVVPDEGQALRGGVCYLGTPERHLAVAVGGRAHLEADGDFRNRTVDLLFETAARHAAPRVAGVVLAGALADGARGLSAIKRRGGKAMVVDSVWAAGPGMPRAALHAVPDADVVGSVEEIAAALARLGRAAAVPAP